MRAQPEPNAPLAAILNADRDDGTLASEPVVPKKRRPRIDSAASLARMPWPAPDWLSDPVHG